MQYRLIISSVSITTNPKQICGGAGSFPSCHLVKAGFTPEKSMFIKGLTYGKFKKKSHTLTFTLMENLDWPVNLTWIPSDCGRKWEYPDGEDMQTPSRKARTLLGIEPSKVHIYKLLTHCRWADRKESARVGIIFLPENPLPHNIYLGTGALFFPEEKWKKKQTLP